MYVKEDKNKKNTGNYYETVKTVEIAQEKQNFIIFYLNF